MKVRIGQQYELGTVQAVAQRCTSDVQKQHIAVGGQQLQALLNLQTWVFWVRKRPTTTFEAYIKYD